HKRDDMARYLSPLLHAGQTFLQKNNTTNVPLYLLATGGMREGLTSDKQSEILQAAHSVMRLHSGAYSVGQQERHARVIPGREEGLYGWVALNYGRGAEEQSHQSHGLLEIGGASMQISFAVPEPQADEEDAERVCLRSGEHRVYSQSWDGFGADSTRRRMRALLVADAGGADAVNRLGVLHDPCLPLGEAGTNLDYASKNTIIGTGNFSACMDLSTRLLASGLLTHPSLPRYALIARESSPHFYGVAHFWFNYAFFAKWGPGYDPHQQYDRQRFLDSATSYCTSTSDEIPWKDGDEDRDSVYTETRCFSAAWMIAVLHDERYGFGLETRRGDGGLSFPVTRELEERANWALGAAALVARHGELKFCPSDREAPQFEAAQDFLPSSSSENVLNSGATTLASSPFGSRSSCSFSSVFGPTSALVSLAVVFLLVGFAYHRNRSRRDLRTPRSANGFVGDVKSMA
ncbi:hypothetical protein DXG03_006601, partial [Asterophora parasitica]